MQGYKIEKNIGKRPSIIINSEKKMKKKSNREI